MESFHDQESIKLRLAGIPQVRVQLIDIAIQHVVDALVKSLVSIQSKDLIAAANRIDIPFGLFTMSYDKFFERRRNDIIYLSLMEYFPRRVLEKAKYCVVLDDLRQMIGKIFRGYQTKEIAPIFGELLKAKKLLTFHLDLKKDYAENLEKLKEIKEEIKLFDRKERVLITMLEVSIQKKAIRCQVLRYVTGRIEQRYSKNYYDTGASQIILRTELEMQNKQNEFDHYDWLVQREERVFECTHMKVAGDSALIKSKIREWSRAYEKDMEQLLADKTYKQNSILVWQRHMEEYKQKIKFFREDSIRLIEWDANRKAEKLERQRQEALKLFKTHHKKHHDEKKDKTKNKKEKHKKGKHEKGKHEKGKHEKGKHEKGKHKKEDETVDGPG